MIISYTGISAELIFLKGENRVWVQYCIFSCRIYTTCVCWYVASNLPLAIVAAGCWKVLLHPGEFPPRLSLVLTLKSRLWEPTKQLVTWYYICTKWCFSIILSTFCKCECSKNINMIAVLLLNWNYSKQKIQKALRLP